MKNGSRILFRLKRILFLAFMGSVANSAGLNVLLVYCTTVAAFVGWSVFAWLNKSMELVAVPLVFLGVSILFLVLGYFCNPPNERGKWAC